MNKIYTGVGSRDTPEHILRIMHDLGHELSNKGYILRSGGASGADSAFESGCDSVNGLKEIYLPWRGFNNNQSKLYTVTREAFQLASTIHPAWDKLSWGAKKLHARNVFQCIGIDLNKSSDFLICWTKYGAKIGGTRTAIVLAEKYSIPIFNLYYSETFDKIWSYIRDKI